jgi:hypothetical protein
MASEMKQFETFDDFLDATENLLFSEEKETAVGWNACYARMEELLKLNEDLAKQVAELNQTSKKAVG